MTVGVVDARQSGILTQGSQVSHGILQSAGFEQRRFDFLQIHFRQETESFFEAHGGQRADGLHVRDGLGLEKGQVAERHFERFRGSGA